MEKPPPIHPPTPPDPRARLPAYISRFIGYRSGPAPYPPLPFPPFSWFPHIPLQIELWILSFIGALGSILLIEAIMTTHTAFREVYNAPMIVTSFGASAVLLFAVPESPLSQPPNFVFGHFVASVIGVCLTKLFELRGGYLDGIQRRGFAVDSFMNGGLSMATALLAQNVLGVVHPPGGPTALSAAVEPSIIALSWDYIPVVLASALIMLGWALVINNVGRRRYPVYWYKADGIVPWFSTRLRARQKRREEMRRRIREEGMKEAAVGGVEVPGRETDGVGGPGWERV